MNWRSATPSLPDGLSVVPTQSAAVAIACCLSILVFLAIAGLLYPIVSLSSHVMHDWNEGWNAYWSDAALSGAPLYPSADALVTNNYPPLSFYVVGLAGRLLGDTIVAGRLIALVSFLVVAINISSWLRTVGTSQLASAFGGLMFVCTTSLMAPQYLAMNDPQWLGHALITTGLTVLWRAPERTSAIISASVLMLAGGFVKHLLIVLPLVTTLWLLQRSYRAGWLWISWSMVLMAATFLAIWLVYGTVFFDNVFHTPREYSLQRIWRHTGSLLPLLPVMLVALASARRLIREDRARFAFAYLVLALLLGIGIAGGTGIDVNRNFDAMIAAGLVSGLIIDHAVGRSLRLRNFSVDAASAYAVILTLVIALQLLNPLQDAVRNLASLRERERAMLNDVLMLRAFGTEQAVCVVPSLCYWAGAPFLIDAFNFGQKLRTGQLAESTCVAPLRRSAYSVIALEKSDPPRSRLLTASCNDSINTYYRVTATSRNTVFLVARTAAEARVF